MVTLLKLLNKDNYVWTIISQQAFDSLKQALVTAPVLAIPDFTKTSIIEIDASGKAIGVVLMQEGRLISFISKT